MPVAAEKPDGTRSVLGSSGNRIRILEEQRQKREMAKKPGEKAKRAIPQSPEKPAAATAVVRSSGSADCSLDSSSSSSSGSNVKSGKSVGLRRANNGNRAVKAKSAVPDEALTVSLAVSLPVKRCDWITPNSEPLYTRFHDEEWGVPIHDDAKLFELLVFSQALAELSWPVILSKRAMFRKLFDGFVATSVANLEVERLLSMRVHGRALLSEPKLRAVIGNAKQLLKIQQDFGSFSNYCWRYLNHKPVNSGFHHARQVPAKTPKSELISKDLMQRGFRCVGPTVVYSFMQAAGMVNDHLVTCLRYNECSHGADTRPRPLPDRTGDTNPPETDGEETCQSNGPCPESN